MAEDLFALARSAMRKAHAPYSKFPVGAAIRTSDGRIYAGCNIEVVSFPEGWCAETTAIAHMVMDGGGRIAEIAVLAEKLALCTPCGGCRQRIAEFADPRTKVHLCDATGVRETLLLGDLFPRGFAADDLG
ncbi:MAG: cytidine deaminase [Aurantimonas endophytica]|jgi:cytidine deaminase|uniref:Cytidine deaminase n=1 Tax=Aurantimonas endophytica TaxID=1522175 RepID=A0A7W6HCR9_9HYPH|nr:cytidine deaminase [Aurantimonas endophytica]MBB4002667.1 cytidine deaminase [Aurantimonas endophytica]MCO6403547.1 cytidine deaminase [Aurantimonas endophytica]